ncbi:hypothetical protein GO755_38335 [Spirosoma sp. HMF4905]|uniref:Uncharacterized protein n=1 Tax=Spirosoma arboris TaxID=2682092 RepID=A0A7K1SQ44_9BACT|nr:hypothetical protein [Spirosoma arboris]MVM35935.1 hypothetical protein [Spirosoma arboris]
MKTTKEDDQKSQLDEEIATIDSLLRNEEFAVEMAKTLDAAYYVGVGKTPPPFLSPKEDTDSVKIKAKDEKIAINLAGFYALECGLGALCAQTNQKPTDLLQTIVANKADSATILLLNRFANATWKAGQPFRSLDRIKRPIFKVASLLPEDEVQKDYAQIEAASIKLLDSMREVQDSSLDGQMKKLRSLLKDEDFALEMATAMAAKYHTAQQKAAPPFLSPEEEKATSKKSAKEQKIATNLAGFYALECGLNYLVTTQHKRPSDILKSIVDDKVSSEDKQLLCRFANATWKAGQPFRGLDRITRDTFTPFYFLSEADVEKDWVQVKAAAGLVLKKLSGSVKIH